MDWRIKLGCQKIIAVCFPGELGRKVHAFMQSRMGRISHFSNDEQEIEIRRGLNMAKFIREQTSFQFEGARILEVGTGWHASDVIAFYLLGAKEIWTCDQLPHLDEKLVLGMVSAFGDWLELVAEQEGVSLDVIQERYDKLRNVQSLADFFDVCSVKYLAPSHFDKLRFPDNYFDLFYSYSVLQRVPPDDLRSYLTSARQALKPGGYSLHVLHHGDHNARHQKKLSPLGYLKYSDMFYDLLQSKRYNYQNRMRHAEFIELILKCGFEILSEVLTKAPESDLPNGKLAKRFVQIPIDDLLVTRTQILCQVNQ